MKLCFRIVFVLHVLCCQAQMEFNSKLDSIIDAKIKDQNVYVEKLVQLQTTYKGDSPEFLGKLYHQFTVAYYKKKDYVKALETIQKAIEIKRSATNSNALDIDKSINMRSLCYNKLGNKEKRLEDLYTLANSKTLTKTTLSAFLNLAQIHKANGDYFKAMNYGSKILNTYKKHRNDKYIIKGHLEMLSIYANLNSRDTSLLDEINYHKQELDKRIENLSPRQKNGYYNNLGVIFRIYKKRQEALSLYKKALEDTTENTSEEDINSIYLNIGEMHSQLKQPDEAKAYYQKVLVTTDSINKSAAYNNLGYYHASSIQNEIENHEKAMQLLGINSAFFGKATFIETLRDFQLKRELLFILIDLSQARLKLYEESNNKKELNEALKIVYAIDDLISVMRLDSEAKLSKLFWIKRGVNSYLEAVKICHLLNKPTEAFYFMEKNKSLYLLEQLGSIQLKNKYNIPDQLLEKEKHLNYKLLLAGNKLKATPENKVYQTTFTNTEQDYFKFTDSIKQRFPEYYKSNLKPELITLNAFQNTLKEDHKNAIEYILGEKEGYGLWITEDTTHVFKLKNYKKLIADISFFKEILKPTLSKKEVSNYQTKGYAIFKTLFPWDAAIAQIKNKPLAIIPDGVLYGFPFEALIVAKKPLLKDNYFINLAEVSYLNSASVSQNLQNIKAIKSYSYLGVAPVKFKSKTLIDLSESESIVKETAALFSSNILLKEDATRTAFFNAKKGNAILHINTHAGIDSKTEIPWLALHDSILSLSELYIMNSPHDLVFLDACKTGDGKLQKGEGIESLSRAFFHAGSKSVVASQWNANEKATNAISLSFFNALKKGESKSFALRKAKLDYLKNNELSDTFPYFWASLTLTGNSEALSKASYTSYWVIGIAILLVFIVFFYRKRKRTT